MPTGHIPTEGVRLIADERDRQINQEGWSEAHDDEHAAGTMVWAAIAYAASAIGLEVRRLTRRAMSEVYADLWPWQPDMDKRDKHNAIRKLAIAGALIAAEIDRRHRRGEK